MKIRTGYAAALLAALVSLPLTACLGNDPEPRVVDPAPVRQDPLASADSLYQAGLFAAAMVAYEQAIAGDSTLSKAYLGYARATEAFYGVSAASIQAELQEIQGDISLVMQHDDAVLTARLQASMKIAKVLGLLADRDTLTRYFRYLDSTASGDPQFGARKEIMGAYVVKADLGMPGFRARDSFPLMDGKVTFANIVSDYAAFLIMKTFLGLYDVDQNEVFNSHDRLLMELLIPNNDGFHLGGLAEQVKTDTVLQAEVNAKILELQSGLGSLSELLEQIQTGADTGSGGGGGDLDSAVVGIGAAMSFYQFGDREDNDGDGCVDEEIIDSLDNDLDGFVDEDARLINGNGVIGSSSTGPADGVDNDRNGTKDGADAGENKFGNGPASYLLTFVVLSGQNDNWVKIKKGAENMDVRLRVQADSLAVRLVPGQRPVPAAYASKLDSAKTLIGGCWRNY